MAASTHSKLYDFLKGYEACCYTGSSLKEVQESLRQILDDELSLHNFSNEDQLLAAKAISRAFDSADTYLTKFYRRMKSVKTSNSFAVKSMADKAKTDSKVLSHLVSLLLQGKTRPLDCIGIGTLNRSGDQCKQVMDICDKCPYYLNNFCIIFSFADDDEGNLIGEAFKFELAESRYLALSLIKLASGLLQTSVVDLNNLMDYYMLFNHILAISKIFELMNPSGEARQAQIDETLELLTREPLDHDSETYKYYESVLKEVFADIKEGKKPYIWDMRDALRRNNEFLHSKYDSELDSYYSLRGTGQSKFTHQYKSMVSSLYEVDAYRHLFTEFDNYTGYVSPYKEMDPSLDVERDKIYCIRTILINNPGKFKGRIIHIFDNPIQDRANYIHRRVARFNESLKCDCTKNQDNGRLFLKQKTLEWSLEEPSERIGIYNFDFSNATDTLDQRFQYLVLEFLMGPEVARFWDTVSRLPKFIQNVDGSYTRYDQKCGQPQGGLGSFDGFALAHHFIFLMDMKLMGLEDHPATDFYRVLGDDSTCNSIVPEFEDYNEDVISTDAEGIPRSRLEMLHLDICENFAGFVINYGKSESAHWNSDEAKLDFAKVTYRNGKFFSPLPFRLLMKYNKSTTAKLACAIWRGERGEGNCRPFMERILTKADNFTLTAIVKSGMLPYLEAFRDPTWSYDIVWLSRLRYAITTTHLTLTMSFLTMDDKTRDFIYQNDVDQGFMDFFEGLNIGYEDIENLPSQHKIWNVLENNTQIVQLLRQVYEFKDDTDNIVLSIYLSPLNKTASSKDWLVRELMDLAYISKMLRLAKSKQDVDLDYIFPDVPEEYIREIQKFSDQFMSRGIAKRPREEAELLKEVLTTLHSLDEILGYKHPVTRMKAELDISSNPELVGDLNSVS